MSKVRQRIDKGLIFVPEVIEAGEDLSIEGEIGVDSSDDKLKVRLDGATQSVVTESQVATLENKSIDADDNTISNLEVDNLKSGVLNVSTSLTGASDTQVPSALAAKTYADNIAGSEAGAVQTNLDDHINDTVGAHAASAISNTPSGNLAATDVQAALNELQADVDTRATASALTAHENLTAAHGATGAVVGTTNTQTLSNKTLTSPILNSPQVNTPSKLEVKQDTKANLVTYASTASNGQLVFATDEKKMYQVIDTFLVDVGGSSEGSNYILNPNAENDTTGYARYQDAASETVVDGTGGTPSANLTFTRSTSAPLRGQASFLIDKDAANMQGYGVSYDFTIDSADQASIQRLTFDYSSGTGYADGYLRAYIYDVTNSRLIEVDNRDIGATSQGKYVGTFQTSSDSVSYRLILHVADSSSTAWNFKLDNVVVGPQTLIKGPIVTDWQTFTPALTSTGGGAVTLSAGGNLTQPNGVWRRVGDSIEYQIGFRNGTSGATGNAGTLIIGLPTGLVPNTTKLVTQVGSVRGDGFTTNASDNLIGSATYSVSSNGLFILTSGTAGFFQVSNVAANVGFTIAGRLPIQGWSSNTLLSEDSGNRLIVVRAKLTTAQTGIASKVIPFNSVDVDTTVSFNSSTGVFTAPESGYYSIEAHALYSALDSVTDTRIQLRKNTVIFNDTYMSRLTEGSTTDATGTVADVVFLNKGDTLDVFAQGDASFNIDNNGNRATIAIHKISSPQTLAGSETVYAIYTSNSGQAVVSGNYAVFEDKVVDTHNAYNTSSGSYSCPVSGCFLVNSGVYTAPIGATIGNALYIEVINLTTGVTYSGKRDDCENNSSRPYTSTVSCLVNASKGDSLRIRFVESLPTVNLNTTSSDNYLMITKVG